MAFKGQGPGLSRNNPIRGGFVPVGRFTATGQDNVSSGLLNALRAAARQATDYEVQAYSGFRPGDPRFHGKGMAVDVRLVDKKTGKALANYQTGQTFRAYENFAQMVRNAQKTLNPELNDKLRWGGYFAGPNANSILGTKGKYGATDLMHFDIGGPTPGMAGGSWLGGLTDIQKGMIPGNPQSVGMGVTNPSPFRPDNMDFQGPKGTFSVGYSAPVTPVTRAPLGPPQPAGTPASISPSSLMSAYSQLGKSLAQAGVQIDGKVINPARAAGASLEIGPDPGTPVPMDNLNMPAVPTTPLPQTKIAPPTVQPAIKQIVQAVSQRAAPVAPATPSLSPGDIYGGAIGRAAATGNNIVSGDALGNTSVTNRYGVTTTTTPNGMSYTSRGLPSLDRPAGGFLDGIFGGAQKAISDPLGSLGNRLSRPGTLPTIGGGLIGGLLGGPVGSLLGAYLGNRFGGGAFPAAPGHFGEVSGPALSKGEMDSLSPAASRAISSGKAGGLY